MRIVSLNAWGGARYDALAGWLPGLGADVVCLQEVTRTPAIGGWTTFRERYPVVGRLSEFVHLSFVDHDRWPSDGRPRLAQGVRLVDRIGGRLAAIGLVDLVGLADTRTSSYTKPIRHASYLLVSHTAAVKNLEIVVEPEVSDHRPLILDLHPMGH